MDSAAGESQTTQAQETANENVTANTNEVVKSQEGSQGNTEHGAENAVKEESNPVDLFGESIDEKLLMGVETEDVSDSQGEEKTADTKPTDEPEAKKEESEEKPEEEGNKPPKGYVPHKALAEERAKRKAAQERLTQLESQLAEAKRVNQPVKPRTDIEAPKDLELSEDVLAFAEENPQFKELIYENSKDGRILRDKIESYGDDDAYAFARTVMIDRNIVASRKQQSVQADSSFINSCVHEMENMFEGGLQGDAAKELVVYLQNEAGLSPDTVTLLTSPNTIITDPRTGKQSFLGVRALELVGAFKEAHTLAKEKDPATIREKLRAELEPEITKQVLSKVNGSKTDSFRDLGNVSANAAERVGRLPTSEEDFAKLSFEQQEKLLMGEF